MPIETFEAELRDELNALPYFKAYTYWEDDGDPLCGWLTAFDICSLGTAEDLLLLSKLTRDDILYISSARPAQLMAVGKWLSVCRFENTPRVLVELGTESGAMTMPGPDGPEVRLPMIGVNSRPFLYRFAANGCAGPNAFQTVILDPR